MTRPPMQEAPELPETLEQAEQLVWDRLKERLDTRRKTGVRVGARFIPDRKRSQHTNIPVPQTIYGDAKPEGYYFEGDLPFQGQGHVVVGAILGVNSDGLRKKVYEDNTIPLFLDAIHEFERIGIVRKVNNQLFITHRGASALDNDKEGLAPVSTRRAAGFNEKFGGSKWGGIAHVYLSEAIDAYRANLDRSAMVMIGCCYEAALHQLADALREASERNVDLQLTGPAATAFTRFCDGQYVPASEIVKFTKRALTKLGLGAFGVQLDFVQTLVAWDRNEVGHPTGANPDREAIAIAIGLFHHYFRQVERFVGKVGGVEGA